MALANPHVPYHVQQAQEACHAMFLLNKRVKHAPRYRQRVYALKRRLIQKLWKRGYFRCVVDDGDKGYLYLFIVGDATYQWHRPEIELPVEVSPYLPDMSPMPYSRCAVLSESQMNQYCNVVQRWLEAVSL